MINEQIKQNAEEYAFALTRSDEIAEHLIHGFIAGAHSQDEEIKELNGQVTLHKERADYYHDLYMKLLNDNKDLEQALAFTEDVVDAQKKELDKLRNPWISVEERLPEKTRNLSPFPDEYDEKVVLVINKQGGKRLAYRDYKEVWRDDYTCEIVNQNYAMITHWMPIPELKK